MHDFKAKRITRNYTQHLKATPDSVFPLLCPVREYDWIEEWKCDLIFSKSGFAEEGCVFTTCFPSDPVENIWVVSRHEKNEAIEFVRTAPGVCTTHYKIHLKDNGDGSCDTVWTQVLTGLSEKGNAHVESITEEKYAAMMAHEERMLNHFLETGEMLKKE